MQWDGIWSRARGDLVLTTERGDEDLLLWEHSTRVAQNARHILKVLRVSGLEPDEATVVAASIYHDAAWVARVKRGSATRNDVLLHTTPDDHREESASIMERSLAKLLPADVLIRASGVIRAINDRDTELPEAQVVSDADHLDEFGILSLWATVRRGVLNGKGVQSAIETWRRRREYRFWEARLKDSFHLDSVRTIARDRLARLERLMGELAEEHQGGDLARMSTVETSDRADSASLA